MIDLPNNLQPEDHQIVSRLKSLIPDKYLNHLRRLRSDVQSPDFGYTLRSLLLAIDTALDTKLREEFRSAIESTRERSAALVAEIFKSVNQLPQATSA